MSSVPWLAGLVCLASLHAQQPSPAQPVDRNEPNGAPAPRVGAPRPRLEASAQRNENVVVHRIDNDAIREANVRLGNRVTIVPEPAVETGAFATEHGQPPGEAVAMRSPSSLSSWHAELSEWHQNSVLNARTFFQVGPVKPSRRNAYGGRFTTNLGKWGGLTANASQNKIRGMVNGNVLAPLAEERTPLATDPETRALVAEWLGAYPSSLPNRPDFDPRALNTNAPQRIDETRGDARWDSPEWAGGRLSAFHLLLRQRIDAFQFVAGQNPDTDIHSHRSRLTWRQALSPASELALGFTFQRVRSALLPEPNAVGPRVRLGFQIEELGPDSQFPIDRAQNTFRWGGLLSRQAAGGRHALTLGADFYRYQLNGIETNNQRGYFQFSNNFGRTAIENLRWGAPTTYEVTLGELSRGYRNWSANLYVADRWRAHPRVQIYYGLRYSLETTPVEVRGMEVLPYPCDCNNFSPRLSLALQLGAGWMARASYTISFGQIPQVTYQQVRNNPPHVRYVQVQNPNLVQPLQGLDLNQTDARYSPTVLSPDLVSPYVHQYNFGLERKLLDRATLRLGYVGSRTIKAISAYIMNRAEPVPGIPLTTATVDQRRPDARYYEVKHILNAGIAYLDAAQASFEMPLARGLAWGVTYTFGKAIDEGADYSGTAANRDLLTARSQWQYESLKDKKGLSAFDSTHAMSVYYSYDLPRAGGQRLPWLLDGWQLSGAALVKSGTPLTLYMGSDAPGFGNVDGGPSDRPHIVDPSILGATISHPNVAPQILRRDRFGYLTPGEHRGSLGRSTFRKAGIGNLNAALSKQWKWGGRREWTALLRGEAYNLTNTPQFDEPQRNLTSPSFGRITNTLNDGRVLQIGLRFML